MSSKTYLPPEEEIKRDWYVVDAADKRLGRLASEIAMVLRGKRKAEYTPHLDTGDFVVEPRMITFGGRALDGLGGREPYQT